MADNNWHDINEPSMPDFGSKKKDEKPERKKPITGIEDNDDKPKPPPDPEVDIVKAEKWIEGEDGFRFNRKCYLEVEAQYRNTENLTIRRRIFGDLFAINPDGTEENLSKQVEGFLDDNGIARLEVPLYYSDGFAEALDKDPDAKCNYKVKNIRHSLGGKIIDSTELEMPVESVEIELELSR